MERFQYYLFDLDGTLTDSGDGIMNAIRHALDKFGIADYDAGLLKKCVGPPLSDCFQEYFGLSAEEAKKAIDYYREYYTAGGMFENAVYDGVKELLEGLKAQGKTLLVATSKPELFARQIMEHFDLAQYFDCIAGAELDESRVRKDEVIAYALEQQDVDLTRAVMIGDRSYDVAGGKAHEMATIGVAYGYGTREELERAGADMIVERPEEILRL